jgi:hypothetical protein
MNWKPRSLLAPILAVALCSGFDRPAAAAEEDEKGFVTLFDGKTLDGWQGSLGGYAVEDGVLICKKSGGGRLFTKDEYSDFVFRFEFKLQPGANNGVALRSPLDGDPAYVGMECQLLDDTAAQYKNLRPYQYHGSIYGVVPAKRGHLKKVGEWNSQEITCRGNHVTVKLNGTVIVDADIEKASTPKTIDGRNHPGLKRTSGYIGFLGHGAHVEFRNIRIHSLDKKSPDKKSLDKKSP